MYLRAIRIVNLILIKAAFHFFHLKCIPLIYTPGVADSSTLRQDLQVTFFHAWLTVRDRNSV